MDELDNILDALTGQGRTKGPIHRTNFITSIIRRLWHGWIGALLLFLLCAIMAWVIHFPLSKIHHTVTKMDVMLIKEREGNRNNNISYEIVGQITGWSTTTNKYDEMAIMMSKPVVERMLKSRYVFDDAIMEKVKSLGHVLSVEDSTELLQSLTEEYTNLIQVIYGEPVKNEKNSIVTLEITSEGAEHNEKVLTGLVDAYNAYTRDYNNMCYKRTLDFLANCIDSIRGEIDKIDFYDENFSESNFIVDIPEQAKSYLSVDSEDEQAIRDMQLQRELLKIIRRYMQDMGHNYIVVPANTGIDDAQINRIVIQFNDLVMRRSNYLTSMGEDAMRVQTITNQIEDQRQAIIISIDKLTQAFDIRLGKYERNKKESEDRLLKMPRKRIVKDKIKRERDIITPLYTLLQQKRVETIIAQAGEQDLVRVITEPYSVDETLISSSKYIYLFGLLLGVILACIYLWFLQVPVERVSLGDVLKDCKLPVWGVLPNVQKSELYVPAIESLLTRIRMSGAKNILLTGGYQEDSDGTLFNNLQELFNQKDIKDIHVSEVGCYHDNPDMPELSNKADATIYCVQAEYSQMRSLDFINYAISEGLLKNAAIVVTNAKTNEKLPINFGAFDYEVPKGFEAVRSRAKK